MKNPFKIKFCEKFGDRKIDGKFFSSWPFPKHLLKNIISVRARQQQQEIRTYFALFYDNFTFTDIKMTPPPPNKRASFWSPLF